MDDFRKMLQIIDNGEMDPCRYFVSICEKVNPRLGSDFRVFDYGVAFYSNALVFLRQMDKQICTSHGHDVLPVEPGKLRDYNPSQTGHTHCFTTLGNQIRSRRVFSVDNVANGIKSHDDESTTPLCSQLKGSTYMSFMILSTARALLWIPYY